MESADEVLTYVARRKEVLRDWLEDQFGAEGRRVIIAVFDGNDSPMCYPADSADEASRSFVDLLSYFRNEYMEFHHPGVPHYCDTPLPGEEIDKIPRGPRRYAEEDKLRRYERELAVCKKYATLRELADSAVAGRDGLAAYILLDRFVGRVDVDVVDLRTV